MASPASTRSFSACRRVRRRLEWARGACAGEKADDRASRRSAGPPGPAWITTPPGTLREIDQHVHAGVPCAETPARRPDNPQGRRFHGLEVMMLRSPAADSLSSSPPAITGDRREIEPVVGLGLERDDEFGRELLDPVEVRRSGDDRNVRQRVDHTFIYLSYNSRPD